MRQTTHLLLLTLMLSSHVTSATENQEPATLRGAAPIQMFMQLCVIGRGRPDAVADHASEKGFEPASAALAEKYLAGSEGDAWHLESEDGNFGLTMLSNGLCSVFVHQGDSATLKKSMESWLPPEGSGFTYEEVQMPSSEPLETTAYKIYKADRLIEQWLITTNSQPNPELVAIMTYERAW